MHEPFFFSIWLRQDGFNFWIFFTAGTKLSLFTWCNYVMWLEKLSYKSTIMPRFLKCSVRFRDSLSYLECRSCLWTLVSCQCWLIKIPTVFSWRMYFFLVLTALLYSIFFLKIIHGKVLLDCNIKNWCNYYIQALQNKEIKILSCPFTHGMWKLYFAPTHKRGKNKVKVSHIVKV